jgi:hypothetical protein
MSANLESSFNLMGAQSSVKSPLNCVNILKFRYVTLVHVWNNFVVELDSESEL